VRTPSRAAPEQTHPKAGSQRGFPLLPLPVTKMGWWWQLLAGHVATSTGAPNPVAPWLLCPWAALTSVYTLGPDPSGLPTNHLGFSPILYSTAEPGVERASTAPRQEDRGPLVGRSRDRKDGSRRAMGAGAVRDQGTGAEGTPPPGTTTTST
jgi:hypothetical protein